MPEISVIVPVYNVEDYLVPCMNSLLAQGFQDFEILLVEDCSTDGSLAVCERFEAEEERVRLLRHSRNRGLSAARNTGMDAARGRYLAFVDSDDLMLPNGLSILYDAAEKPGADLAYAGQYYVPVFAEGSKSKVVELALCTKGEDSPTSIPDDLAKRLEIWLNRMFLDTAWNKLYRREFIEEHALRFDEGISTMEDVWFSFRVLCLARSIALVPDVFYLYRQNPASIFHQAPTGERLREDLRNLMEGCRILSGFMDSMEFFRQNPQIRYMVMECTTRVCMGRVRSIYASLPPHELYETVRDELLPIFGENAAFVTSLYQMANALHTGCVQILENGAEHPGNLWQPELLALADCLRTAREDQDTFLSPMGE